MATAPRSRWFQYGLRTMFVLVTLAALICALILGMVREWRVVQGRMAARQWIDQIGAGAVWSNDYPDIAPWPTAHIAFWRTWLGDEAVPAMLLSKELPSEYIDQMRKHFPEAQIEVRPIYNSRIEPSIPAPPPVP